MKLWNSKVSSKANTARKCFDFFSLLFLVLHPILNQISKMKLRNQLLQRVATVPPLPLPQHLLTKLESGGRMYQEKASVFRWLHQTDANWVCSAYHHCVVIVFYLESLWLTIYQLGDVVDFSDRRYLHTPTPGPSPPPTTPTTPSSQTMTRFVLRSTTVFWLKSSQALEEKSWDSSPASDTTAAPTTVSPMTIQPYVCWSPIDHWHVERRYCVLLVKVLLCSK